MTYHIAICDDEPAELTRLTAITRGWAAERGVISAVTCFPSAEAFLFRYEEDKSFNILLLDIEMGGLNGVELAKEIRRGNGAAQIIFVTGYMEYITDGYEVEALHYLLKPVKEEKLFSVLDRAVLKLGRAEKYMTLYLGDESVRLSLAEIRYIEVNRNYVTVHGKESFTVKTTLHTIEKELDGSFLRVGRSFIVNLKYIRRVTKTEIALSNGATVPLPRGAYDAVNRAVIERL